MELQAKENEGLVKASDPSMALYLAELERSRLIHFSHQGVVQLSQSFHSA
jgi:hypothetical protein